MISVLPGTSDAPEVYWEYGRFYWTKPTLRRSYISGETRRLNTIRVRSTLYIFFQIRIGTGIALLQISKSRCSRN